MTLHSPVAAAAVLGKEGDLPFRKVDSTMMVDGTVHGMMDVLCTLLNLIKLYKT